MELWKYIGRIAWVVGILAGAATCFKYCQTEDSLGLTLFVHGPKSKTDIVLANEGRIIIDFGNDRRSAKIGENGQVNFEEIPNRFKKATFIIDIKNTKIYELAYPGKEYPYSTDPIYIALKRKSLVEGVIRQFDEAPIEGAQITIDRDLTLTAQSNRYGLFSTTIPQSKTKLSYEIYVEKEGYLDKTIIYNIGSSGRIDIRLKSITPN